jgi:hypothetical protein
MKNISHAGADNLEALAHSNLSRTKRKQLGAAFNSTSLHKLPKSGEWRKLEVYGIAPHEEGMYSISMTGSHSDGGVVFFDNLKIESAEYK